MKKLIVALALALIATAGHAGDIAFQENKGGGVIVLTDTACTGQTPGMIAYSLHSSGKTIYGCWKLYEAGDQVMVHWNDGDDYNYISSNFILTEYGESKGKTSKTEI